MDMNTRRSSTFAAIILAAFLVMISVASACVTFKGKMVVDGHDGDTTVVGTGNQHAYCSTGHPVTAAAGHLTDNITITVSPQTCSDTGAGGSTNNKLPDGTYEVRYNSRTSYTDDGTKWTMIGSSGCFFPANAPTTSTLGQLSVTSGSGSWTGTLLDGLNQALPSPLVPMPSPEGTAANICVGAPGIAAGANDSGGAPGMLAPFRLLVI